ncbi:MAG: AraC family transcriptional regulator [Alphaproteobacteria bacterium]|nr:AraC family transcriptional regulator [Alphaproteobacteria bacterium]
MLVLPKLAIGDYQAREFEDTSRFSGYLNEWRYNTSKTIKPLGNEKFRAKATGCAQSSLCITSFSASSFYEEFTLSDSVVFLMPMHGKLKIGGEEAESSLVGGKAAAILVGGNWRVDYHRASVLRFDFRKNVFFDSSSLKDMLPLISMIDLAAVDAPVLELLHSISGCFVSSQNSLAEKYFMNLSNTLIDIIKGIYENNGPGLLRETGEMLSRVDEAVELIADAVLADLAQPLSLKEMEIISGLSRRAIQYGFQRRFGCSPITWQLRERLIGSYNALQRVGGNKTITEVAFDYGFASSSTFTAYFKKHFGMTPTELRSSVRRQTREKAGIPPIPNRMVENSTLDTICKT